LRISFFYLFPLTSFIEIIKTNIQKAIIPIPIDVSIIIKKDVELPKGVSCTVPLNQFVAKPTLPAKTTIHSNQRMTKNLINADDFSFL